ncbi:MAG: ABC transporter substrate-binding protein [Anaerolineae bacterium]|nr:ABC transporter substrate-binding protein [Anaerolineae bacterium]
MRKAVFALMVIAAALAASLAPLAGRTQAQDAPKLRMGLLPILDVLPFYVADEAGYFAAEGLEIELIPVSSALERDQLVIAGAIDGMVNDLISTGIFNQDEPLVQIVALARRAYPDYPQFRLLAAPRSNITLPSDLINVEIGISENSVIHYITQRILEAEGISAEDLSFRAEPNIAIRFQLLMEGQFKAVCLPDPLAQAAVVGGAILIADDTSLVESQISQSVLGFRTEVIEEQPEAVEGFLRAWMRAAEDINADPEAYRALWLEKTNVPDSVKDTYALPPFPTYEITTEAAWEDTVAWLIEQDIVESTASYADTINPAFLEAIAPAADAAQGEALFASLGCIGCHSLDGTASAGPSVAGVAGRAGNTVAGLSAEDYLHQAIVEPAAFVVEGFGPIMPPYDTLSEADVAALVAYLLTLE